MSANAQATLLTVAAIIRNDEVLYEGNLVDYFRSIFFHAQNLRNPYHNFRHMLSVLCRCYEACVYYGEELSLRQRRNLLIAALFHDLDHSGQMGNDDLNIEKAVRALKKYIIFMDERWFVKIERLVRCTEYPYKIDSRDLDLMGQILRDADLAQALEMAWIQQVVFGLSQEWNKTPLEVLSRQARFHKDLVFVTEWGQQRFPQSLVDTKVSEAEEILALLKT